MFRKSEQVRRDNQAIADRRAIRGRSRNCAQSVVFKFKIWIGIIIANLETETIQWFGEIAETVRSSHFNTINSAGVITGGNRCCEEIDILIVDIEGFGKPDRVKSAVKTLVIGIERQDRILVGIPFETDVEIPREQRLGQRIAGCAYVVETSRNGIRWSSKLVIVIETEDPTISQGRRIRARQGTIDGETAQ